MDLQKCQVLYYEFLFSSNVLIVHLLMCCCMFVITSLPCAVCSLYTVVRSICTYHFLMFSMILSAFVANKRLHNLSVQYFLLLILQEDGCRTHDLLFTTLVICIQW